MKVVQMLFIIFLFSSCGQTNSNMDSSTVNTQALTCNMNSGKICGQPPMPPCAPNAFCAQVMPNPVTYDNECKMKEAGSGFVQYGQCL